MDVFKRAFYGAKSEFNSEARRLMLLPLGVNLLTPEKPWDETVGKVNLHNGAGKVAMFIGRPLGGGSFGTVYKALASVQKKKDGALAAIPVAVKLSGAMLDLRNAELAETMAYAHLSMDEECSPFVTCLYAIVATKMHPGDLQWRYGLVMELMDGDLSALARERIAKMPGLTPEQRYSWLLFLALFMIYDLNYLHSNGWAHNDVKPENYLYKWEAGAARPKIKITDLGFACAPKLGTVLMHEGGKHAKDQLRLLQSYRSATRQGLGMLPPAANVSCSRATTPFYQTPKWDGVVDRTKPTSGLAENFENDAHAISMSAKALFVECGFDLGAVVLARFFDHEFKRTWGPYKTGEDTDDRWELLRATHVPYEFLSEPMREVGRRFSEAMKGMAAGTTSVGDALGLVAEQLSDAAKIAPF